MSKQGANNYSKLRGRWWRLKGHLLFALWFACPLLAWAQEGGGVAPGVKVLATLEGDVYAWSPDGKRLAYVAQDGVWVVEAPEFRQPRRLIRKGLCAGGACPGQQLMWSPDGQQLAFVDSRPGDGWSTIWLANADGSHVRDLLPPGTPHDGPGARAVGISAWLSNRGIAFEEHCGTGCTALYMLDVERGTSQRFCAAEASYHWAPTKTRAIVNHHYSGTGAPTLGLVDVARPDELCAAILGEEDTEGPAEGYWFNDWSPDGKRVLYTGVVPGNPQYPGTPQYNLYVWEVESGRREQLVSNAGWAAWSPDSSKIAFRLFGEPRYGQSKQVSGTDFVTNKPFQVYLVVMEVVTKTVSTLMPLGRKPMEPGKVMEWAFLRPVWSPDGKRLAIQDGEGNLSLIQADGKDLRPITRGMQVKAAWSPDGQRLALWPTGRFGSVKESSGLDRFLPPVGKEDAALSDAELIERYFQQVLARGPEVIGGPYNFFLEDYVQVLEEMGKVEAAEEQYHKALELAQRSEQWSGTELETELKNFYAAFLCRHGREKEATEFGTCPPPSSSLPEELLRHQPEMRLGRTFLPYNLREDRQGAGQQDSLRSSRAETSAVPQQQPSLYLVEVLEKGE